MVGPTRFFASHNLLFGLPREYSSRLLANAPVIFVKQGKTLFEIGAAAGGCYYLEHGVLKVSIASPKGVQSESLRSWDPEPLSANLQ